jgi:tetratricopeptide (TPR) repeat protein
VVGPNGLIAAPRLNREVIHDLSGMSFNLPGYWLRPPVYDSFPYDAYTSPSKEMAVSYGVAVQEYPVEPTDLAGEFVDEIRGLPGYEVLYDTLAEEERVVGDAVWRLITVMAQDGTDQRVFQRAVTWRGCVEFRLTFQNRPRTWDVYDRLRRDILATTQLSYPRTIREGEENLKLMPDGWKLHSDLGRAYAIYGEIEQAESELLRARLMAPEMSEPLFWLLFLYDRYDMRPVERRALVSEALREHDNNADMLMLTYEVCNRLGDRDCAGRSLSLAQQSYPHLPRLQRYIEEYGGDEQLPELDVIADDLDVGSGDGDRAGQLTGEP